MTEQPPAQKLQAMEASNNTAQTSINVESNQSQQFSSINDLYGRRKVPFLVYGTDVLVDSKGLFQSDYFTIPYSGASSLLADCNRILEDPKAPAPSNIGLMLSLQRVF